MAFKVGQESIAGGYIGSSSASAIYIGAVLVWSAATPTPPTPPVTTDKTLVITDVEESPMMGKDRDCSMSNIFDFTSTWNDAEYQANNSLDVYSPFSGSYGNRTITIVGPFTGSSYVVHFSGVESICQPINNDITFQFSADTAEIMSNYTPTEPDPECECIQEGGTWDGSECHHEEPPVDPCIEDPCSCDPNPDECYCIQNGGTWDGSECIYDEPLTATTIALSVDQSVASAITINFYKMYNDDPMGGGNWTESEVLGTFDLEVSLGAETMWDLVSSSITSAITSAELLGDWWQGEEYKLSVVSPLLDQNCDPDTTYAFKALVHTYDGGTIKAKCRDINTSDETICWNAELSIDYEDVSVIRTLIITDLPDFDQLHDMYDGWNVEITDNDKFSFSMNKYYEMGQEEWIEDVSFDGYDNPNVTYTLSGTTLIVNGDWDAYDGEGQGEYTLNMKFSTNNCQYDDETYVAGEAQLQFTGYSETIQFDDGNPICETYLIIDISNIPNDGNVHEYKVVNSDNETLSVLKIDTSDWSYENTDDPDGYGYSFHTDEFDDQGDLSQGNARWKLKGQFIGTYYIYVDGSPLQSAPDYDGSEMVAYVDASTDAMDTYSCYGEWDCVENNPLCTWDPNTRTCDCGGE